MSNSVASNERILEVLRKISTDQQLPVQRRRPAMSDLEVISLGLTAEYMGIDSENDLFRKLPSALACKIERTVYNRRKRRLLPYQDAIRMKLAESFNEFEDVFVVDSMPLEVCKGTKSINDRVYEAASQVSKARYGIIVMDFPEKPNELFIPQIIGLNYIE